jgi:sulfite reductase alpha subunit-like flavoprotein
MGAEVRRAFVDVVRVHGGGRGGEGVSAEAAEAFVKQLQADGRYTQELWG